MSRCQRGFTITEVLMAVAIGGVALLALMGIATFFTESIGYAEFRSEVAQLQPVLAENFRGNPGCTCLMRTSGQTIDLSNPSSAITFGPTTKFQNASYTTDPSDPTACANLGSTTTLIDGSTGENMQRSKLVSTKIDRVAQNAPGYYLAHVAFTFEPKQKVLGAQSTIFDFMATFKGTAAGSTLTITDCSDSDMPDPDPTPVPPAPTPTTTAWAHQSTEWTHGKYTYRNAAEVAAIRAARPSCIFGNSDAPLIYGACTIGNTCNSEGKKGDSKYSESIWIYKCIDPTAP